MKYEIKPLEGNDDGFRQFDVTLRIESYDEYVCSITIADSSTFVGDVYAAGHGDGDIKYGDVPLRSAGRPVEAQLDSTT